MGPRKRSKPNPKAKTQPVSEETRLCQGPELQTEGSVRSAVRGSLPLDESKTVDPVHTSVNGASTVSAHGVFVYTNEQFH